MLGTWLLVLLPAVAAIVYGIALIFLINKLPAGTDRMQAIARAIEDGAKAYLKRQFSTIALVAVVFFAVLWWFLGWKTGLGFLIGAAFSGLAGYLGMRVSVKANVRTTEAAKTGLKEALDVAVKGGSITGLLVVGLGLLGVAGFYALTHNLAALVGLGFGASLISIFARLGGGIFTKAADVGADLVGKVEAGIPEDDPRNPAVIADNVGDNVGDCAGMAADLFETYAVTCVATMLLGSLLYANSPSAVLYPLALGAVAVIASVIGMNFFTLGKDKNIMNALYKGLGVAGVLAAIGFYPITMRMMGDTPGVNPMNLFYCAILGLVVTALLIMIT